MMGSRRRNRRDTFDAPLPVVEADVAHHAEAYSPTETIAKIQDETMLLEDSEREPADAEVPPEPEPEPLPEAGYVVLPTLYDGWPHLFGREPAPFGEDTPEDTPRYGWVDVSGATREQAEEFLGGDLVSWAGNDAIVRAPGGGTLTAHDGDRVLRDEDGLRVECTRAFKEWETGEFQAAIAAGDAT